MTHAFALYADSVPPDVRGRWAMLWAYANLLAGALWSSNPDIYALRTAWEVCTRVGDDTLSHLPVPSVPSQLLARRTDDEPAIPPLTFSPEQLVEGFAFYSQARELYDFFPHDEVDTYLTRNFAPETPAGTLHRYLGEELGLQLTHPLAGALIEGALLCFVCPALAMQPERLVWEEIHPGLRFHAAVDALKQIGPPFPDRPGDAWDLAYIQYAFGSNCPAARDNTRVSELLRTLPVPSTAGTDDFDLRNKLYRQGVFLSALLLRQVFPWIYGEPNLMAWDKHVGLRAYVNRLWMPPVVVTPNEVDAFTVRLGEGSDGTRLAYGSSDGTAWIDADDSDSAERDAIAALCYSVSRYVRYDLDRYGVLRRTLNILKRLPRGTEGSGALVFNHLMDIPGVRNDMAVAAQIATALAT
jgi:hypothetical protein